MMDKRFGMPASPATDTTCPDALPDEPDPFMGTDVGVPSRKGRWSALALLLVMLGTLFGVHLVTNPQISYVDEFAHFDYVSKLADGRLMRANEFVGQETMHAEACRGIVGGFQPPSCSKQGDYDHELFQYRGLSTAAQHPPLYYALTAGIALTLENAWFIDDDTRLTASRLGSIAWYVAAAVLLLHLMHSLGARWLLAAGIILLITATPTTLEAAGRVNNDAASYFAGAICLWVLLRVARGSRSFLLPAIVGAVVITLKATNMVALVAVAISMVAIAIQRRDPRPALQGLAAFFAGSAAYVGWTAIVGNRALPEPNPPIVQNAAFELESLGVGEVALQLYSLLTPVASPPLGASLTGGHMANVTAISLHLFLLLSIGAALYASKEIRGAREIGIGVILAAILVPPGIVLSIWFSQDLFVPLHGRYGLSLLPLWAGMLALIGARSAGLRLTIWGLGIANSAILILLMLR
jgi:hypothetical protein